MFPRWWWGCGSKHSGNIRIGYVLYTLVHRRVRIKLDLHKHILFVESFFVEFM